MSRICTAVSSHLRGLHTAGSSALSTVVLVTFRAITAKLSSWGEKGGFQNFHPKKPNYLKLNETLLPESHRKQRATALLDPWVRRLAMKNGSALS